MIFKNFAHLVFSFQKLDIDESYADSQEYNFIYLFLILHFLYLTKLFEYSMVLRKQR